MVTKSLVLLGYLFSLVSRFTGVTGSTGPHHFTDLTEFAGLLVSCSLFSLVLMVFPVVPLGSVDILVSLVLLGTLVLFLS